MKPPARDLEGIVQKLTAMREEGARLLADGDADGQNLLTVAEMALESIADGNWSDLPGLQDEAYEWRRRLKDWPMLQSARDANEAKRIDADACKKKWRRLAEAILAEPGKARWRKNALAQEIVDREENEGRKASYIRKLL